MLRADARSNFFLIALCAFALVVGIGVWLVKHSDSEGGADRGDGRENVRQRAVTNASGTEKHPRQHSPSTSADGEKNRHAIAERNFQNPNTADPFAAFTAWLEEFRGGNDDQQAGLIPRGVALAEARRPLMRRLIHENPEVALAHALRLDEFHALPPEIQALVEKPFSHHAETEVFPRCDGTSASRHPELRTTQEFDIHLNPIAAADLPASLDAFTFGWRVEAPSRTRTPVQGIALDDLAALRSSIFQELNAAEVAVAENLFVNANPYPGFGFASGRPLPAEPVVALAGGKLFYFSDRSTLEDFERRVAKLETTVWRKDGAIVIFDQLAALAAAAVEASDSDPAGFDLSAIEEQFAEPPPAAPRKVLMIRVDFSNKTGSPIATSTLQARMDGEVNNQCRDMSFGNVTLDTTVEATLVRMPRPTTYYNGTDDGSKKNSALYNDAIAAAQAAGINTSGYTHRCIVMKGIGMGYCGLATVGGGKIWLPCHGSKVIVHELGHNFGVGHASFHTPTNGNDPLGAGTSSKYGDNTDIMGSGGVSAGHFHPQFKTKLSWLSGAQRHNFNSGNTNNTYRIYRFDHPDTDEANARRAIRVYRGTNNEYLWIGYRQRYGGSNYQNYLKGAQIRWQKAGSSKSWLIDVTAGGGKNNAGLGVGRTFSDTRRDLHITTLKRGGGNPDQWLDVQVRRGPFAGNNPPTINLLHALKKVPVNTSMTVGAIAADPDGDALAYYFDFKDGLVIGNDGTAASRNYTWTSKGSKNLTVTVSDRKGLVATQSVNLTVHNKINPPGNVQASDATHQGVVEVTWNNVSAAGSYAVFRSPSTSMLEAEQVGTSSGLSFSDASTVPNVTYHYWVQSLGSDAASILGGSDSGSALPPVPQLDLSSAAEVTVMWQAPPTLLAYVVYRGTTPDPAQAQRLGGSASGSYSDTRAIAGVLYYWFIQPGGNGPLSEPVAGRRIFEAPADFALAQSPENEISMTWSLPGGQVEGYEIRRSTVNDVDGAEVIAAPTLGELSHDDTSAPRGAGLHYWIRAISSTTTGEWSAAGNLFSMKHSFAEFADSYGLIGEDALPDRDPDDDGFTTFEEWAQGGFDPARSAEAPPLIQRFQAIGGNEYFTVAYLRIPGGSENGSMYRQAAVNYEGKGGTTPDKWDQVPVSALPPANLPAPPAGYEWGCYRLPLPSDAAADGYLKINLSAPEP